MSDISEAKRRLPLPALMEREGLGECAKKSARCPFHDDRHNSFSVWKNGTGLWRWKCHAGCGEGDEITFLQIHRDIRNSDATKLFLEMAGAIGAIPAQPFRTERNIKIEQKPLDWRVCVEAFTEKHVEELAESRGYSIEFCSWLRERGLVGLYNGRIAFPVHDRAGNVIAAHYRLDDCSWRYYPKGVNIRPLIIGELIASERIQVFESQWDCFAFMDASGERSGFVITRGASNGALVSNLIAENSTVYLWTQNDAAGDKWQQDICAKTNAVVRRVKIPAPHKDLNDWTRAGATADDLLAAMVNAEVVRAFEGFAGSAGGQELESKKPFPLASLPPLVEAMVKEVCATERVPESLVGCCALGILSASIGAGLAAQSASNRVTRGNIYLLASAESGSGKSETFRHMAKPFQQFEMDRIKRWKELERPDAIAMRELLEADIKERKRQYAKHHDDNIGEEVKEFEREMEELQKRLDAPTLSCEDVTTEKLADLLSKNDEQLTSLSPDALSIVNILLGRYNKLDRTDEGLYLKAYSGDPCVVHRMSRDPISLESPCLTALWLTQPDKVESLLHERSLNEGGLIPRILPCHTDCEPREIGKNPPSISSSVEKAYAGLIFGLLETYRLAMERFTIVPTSEALEALNDHHDAIVKRRRGELRDVTSYAARWNEQAWRIAVCLHAGLHGAYAHEQKLELDTVRRAIELAEWFAAQQLEILSASREKARRELWDEVLSLLDDRPKGIRASDVYRARIVRYADEAHALLAAMESKGELSGRDEQPETGGHATRIFTRAQK